MILPVDRYRPERSRSPVEYIPGRDYGCNSRKEIRTEMLTSVSWRCYHFGAQFQLEFFAETIGGYSTGILENVKKLHLISDDRHLR